MNKPLSVVDRDSMRAGIDQIVDWSKAAVDLVIQLHETSPDFYKNFGESRANMMGLVDKRGALDFYHGGLRARDADGGADLRSRRLRDLQERAPGRREELELHEVPAHQDAGRGQGLVSRRAAGAGAGLRRDADAARRSRAPHVPQRSAAASRCTAR